MTVRAAILFVLALIVGACVPKHHVVTNAGVGMGAALAPVVDGPFRLLFAGPKGESTSDAQVTLAFSRAVRGPDTPARVVRESDGQAIDGSWLWFGDSTAVFEPRAPLPQASTYRVEPQALTATDGASLPASAPFTFSTDRPKLVIVRYELDEKKDRHLVHVELDQPVTPAAAAFRLEGRDALDRPPRAIPFRVTDTAASKEITLEADVAVARLEDVTVIATTALRATAGPLAPTAEMRMPLEGVGPFKMELSCTAPDAKEREPIRMPASVAPKCDDQESIRLDFSRPVKTRDLLRHLTFVAPAKASAEQLEALNARGPDDDSYTLDLDVLLGVEPGRTYKLVIKAGLVIGDKERLGTDQVIAIETIDRRPSLVWRDLQSANTIVESARPALDLGFFVTNVAKVETTTAAIGEEDVARFFFPADPADRKAPDATWVRARAKSTSHVINVTAKKNEAASAKVRVAGDRAVGASGAYAVATHAAGVDDDVRLLSITDLGVTAKWSPHGSLLWVTRLSTAEPVQGATISLRHVTPGSIAEAFTTTTDREGLATIPAAAHAGFLRNSSHDEPRDGALLVVKHAADWTYLPLPELDPSLMTAIGDVFVERGLYRPGETIFAKGYFRMPGPKGFTSLAGQSAYIEAFDAADRVFHGETVTIDAFGAFSTQIAIPKTVRLGRSYLRARVGTAAPPDSARRGGRWGRDRHWPARASFVVDAFRTPEFKVEMKADAPGVVRGGSATLTTSAAYLSGPPMSDLPINVSVSRQRSMFAPPGNDAFAFYPGPFIEEERPEDRRKPLAPTSGKLDAEGHYRFSYPFPGGTTAATPEVYAFDVDVADVSKAFSMGDRAEVIVHPSDVYLGVGFQSLEEPLVPGKHARAELIATGIDGLRRGGIAARLELFRAQSKGPPIATGRSCTVTAEATSIAGCDLAVSDEGQHWIKASARDALGRELVSARSFFVLPKNTKPPPPAPPAPPTPPPTPLSFADICKLHSSGPHIALAIEGWTYSEPFAYGQNAHVCLHSRDDAPKSARGLFTLEREGVLRHEPIHDFHASPWKLFDLPLSEDVFPNAHAVLVEAVGRSAPFPTKEGVGDEGHPVSNSVNQRLLVAAPPSKKLTVTLDTPKEASPGAEIEVKLRVNDGDGRPTAAQVTLWAVDEGIQLLVPYSVPKLSELFHEERGADVIERDTRSEIYFERGGMHRTKAPSLRQGATSVGDRTLIGRSVFRPTAFFLPNVVTNANGVATVRTKLPDNLTTWEVFAVAATANDAFGQGTASFPTNKTLMVRPQLPRFLRAGDRFEATVIVDSLLEQPTEVRLTAGATGVLEVKSGPLAAKIPAKGHVPLQIAVEAKAAGSGTLVFDASVPNGPRDRVTVTEEVASIASIETSAISGEVPRASGKVTIREPLGDLGQVSSDVGGFDARISTTPLVGLADSMNGLLDYPYGCTEQLASRLLPLVRLRKLAQEVGVALPANVDASVRSSLASLLSHQQADGGFGFWRESRKSEAWLTLLAFDALQTAEAHGYVVPRSSMDQARAFLESSKDPIDPPAQALLEDLLATAKKPRVDKLRALAADRSLPLHAQALVAHGLAAVDPALAKPLLAAITAQAQSSGTAITFAEAAPTYLSSNTRTTAMVLRALLANELHSPLVPKLVRGLLSLRRDGRWPTTQDSAWALDALEAARSLYAVQPGQMEVHVALAQKPFGMASFAGVPRGETLSTAIPMSRLLAAPGASVEIESDGTRPLYYEGALRYARRAPPMAPLEHGLSIARSLRPLNPERPELHVGDYVVADVVVVSSVARDQVVIDDPIPAGFEAVNETFAAMDRAPILRDLATTLTHRELHDDRVLSFFDALPAGVQRTRYVLRVIAKGRFAQPPAKAECMYAPDVFGRTASTWVETR